ncbi:MAG: hypothetical protein L3K15_08140 [Thermoplasmata archaeon]|nr:hypothetical protein [Thermoplasmata archaeon]
MTAKPPRPRLPESSLAPPVRRHLEAEGFRVWVDPDGSDFLDVVARRNHEVGLVELKIADWKTVLVQALRRRAWGDWVAVALPRRSLASKVLARSSRGRAARVGVWVVAEEKVEVLRPAVPLYDPGEPDPFEEPRARLRLFLDAMETGGLPEGFEWGLAAHAARATHRRRPALDWTMDEFPSGGSEP